MLAIGCRIVRAILDMALPFCSQILTSIADLIYPPRCPLCGELTELRDAACGACERRLIRLEGAAHVDLPWRIWIGSARSCFAHDGPIKRALWSFKYEGEMHSFPFFRSSLAEELGRMGGYDLVTAVPMQAGRVVGRGINASAVLAGSVARRLGIPFDRAALARGRSARRQVGLLREERMKNVRGAFLPRPAFEGRVEGRRVLLIDDVMTTGATLNECARALIAAGAELVDALTLARAL